MLPASFSGSIGKRFRGLGWGILFLGSLILGGLLRGEDLGAQPLHCDEAVQAWRLRELWRSGQVAYDPREYHGPVLPLAAFFATQAAGYGGFNELNEEILRAVPAFFGSLLILGCLFLYAPLGRDSALWAGLWTAVSPTFVFYNRCFIHETLLVFFSFLALAAVIRYGVVIGGITSTEIASRGREAHRGEPSDQNPAQARTDDSKPVQSRWVWVLILGGALGLMHATKETCVLVATSLVIAALLCLSPQGKGFWRTVGRDAAAATLIAMGLSAAIYSQGLRNWLAVADSYRSYFHYLTRAAGAGEAAGHVGPWYYYFALLFGVHPFEGTTYTEWPVLVLAAFGVVGGLRAGRSDRYRRQIVASLATYTVILAALYSILPYKTPWCALGFLHGIILLAGVGSAALWRSEIGGLVRWPLRAILIGLFVWVAVSSWRQISPSADWSKHPLAYSPSSPDVPRLAGELMRLLPAEDTHQPQIQVICEDHDYWPLPWYFRKLNQVGWYPSVPTGPPAPVVICSPRLEAQVLEHLYSQPPPGKRALYVPFERQDDGPLSRPWELRPGVSLLVLVQWRLLEGLVGGQVGPQAHMRLQRP